MSVTVRMNNTITKSAARDIGRYAMRGVEVSPRRLRIDGVFLAATDGCQVAIRTAPGQADSRHIIPPDVLPKTKTERTITFDNGHGDGHWTSSDGASAEVDEGSFPAIGDVLPKAGDSHVVFGLDAKLFKKLADAISEDGKVTLFIPVPHPSMWPEVRQPVLAMGQNLGDSQAIGVIMPYQAAEDARDHYNRLRDEYVETRFFAR